MPPNLAEGKLLSRYVAQGLALGAALTPSVVGYNLGHCKGAVPRELQDQLERTRPI